MGNLLGTHGVSFILVFLEGIISFFSPCVIPLIPVYMSYLAGSGRKTGEDGTVIFERKKVFLHTLFFVLGISFSFFILGMSFTALGSLFSSNKLILTRAGGILIVLLGLFQLGIFDLTFLQKERKIRFRLPENKMNPGIALVMGFTFSFAWTPCIGPALSSVLIMASGASTALVGNLLVFVYAIGFLLPFLVLGLFTARVLNFLKARKNLMKYTIKAGGAILVIMGVMIFTGWMNGVSGYLNSIGSNQQESAQSTEEKSTDRITSESTETEANNSQKIAAIDFTLTDQYGKEHTLSEYKGKVVFLNFWATWCPPCNKEMPDIEALYQKYNLNQDEVVILGVANPASTEYPNNQDIDEASIKSFLEEKNFTFPTVFDETGDVFTKYNISAFPTTYIIGKDGNFVGYVPGMMTKDIMQNVVEQALK